MKQKYSILFQFNEELRRIADEVISVPQKVKRPKDLFLSFVIAKAYKTHRAITILCAEGHGQDAAVLVRTLFDLLITMLYIMADESDERLLRYASFDWILRRKMYRYGIEQPNIKAELEARGMLAGSGDDGIDEILRQAEAAQEKYQYRSVWSDKNIEEMAREVGRWNEYKTVFAIQSNIVHSNSRSMLEYMTIDGDNIMFHVDKSDNWVEQSLVASFDFFVAIVERVSEEFSRDLHQKIEDLVHRYVEEVGKLAAIGNKQD